MKKKNLIVYLFFIMVLLLAPNKVMADHPTSGSITCTYTLNYQNAYEREKSKIKLSVYIKDGSIDRNWEADTLNTTEGLKHKMESGIGHYDYERLTIGEFVGTNGKKQDWVCPKIAYGIRDDQQGGYYMVVKTANNWSNADTQLFEDVDYAVMNKGLSGIESNHKTPTSTTTDNSDITEMCRFNVKYGSKINDVQIAINHTKKTAKYMINNGGYKSLDEFDFDRGCPGEIRYCVMDKSVGDFILTEKKNCAEYLSGTDNFLLLQNQLISNDKGQTVIFDADGNTNVISDETGQTDLVDGKDAEDAKNDVINLITNPIDTTCEEILGDTIDIINEVLNWIKILAPILLILFGSIDFAKAVLTDDDKALKKATGDFVKRAIAAATLFFVPLIVNLLLGLDGIKDVVGEALCEGIGKVVIK